MKRSILFAFVLASLSFSACEREDLYPEIPDCVQVKIPGQEDSSDHENRIMAPADLVSIYRYKNNTKSYFELVYVTRDGFTELYDQNCEYVCSPNGGVWGGGAGDCPDWLDIDDRELLWQQE